MPTTSSRTRSERPPEPRAAAEARPAARGAGVRSPRRPPRAGCRPGPASGSGPWGVSESVRPGAAAGRIASRLDQRRQRQQRVDEAVVEHHIRKLQTLDPAQRDQPGIPRPRPHEIHLACRLTHVVPAVSKHHHASRSHARQTHRNPPRTRHRGKNPWDRLPACHFLTRDPLNSKAAEPVPRKTHPKTPSQ
jgi:hypothetical protein